MRKFLISIVLALAASTVQADDVRFAVYALTHHVDKGDHNKRHPMLQLEYQRKLIGGAFVNSANKISWYAGRRIMDPWQDRIFVEIGMVTGYQSTLVRSLRVGYEVTRHIDIVAMPAFESAHGWKISRPISVLATIIKF